MRVLLVIALAACSAACSADRRAGPAWPKLSIGEADGGESLAPRLPAREIAEISDDDPAEDLAADDPPPPAAPVAGSSSAASDLPAAALAEPDTEEPITFEEEIVIEVDD